MVVHTSQFRVYYEDTDAGGVVYYANYLKFAERARTEWLRETYGISQQEWLTEKKTGFVVRDVNATFLKSARLDDALNVETQVLKQAKSYFEMGQKITRDAQLLVELTVKIVCVDTTKMLPKRLPEILII